MVATADIHVLIMDFATRLTAARKRQGLTQQALAEHAGVHVTQLRRYEADTAPTLDVLRNMAIVLHVSIDSLAFGEDERGPSDDLKLAFEAVTRLDPDEQAMIRQLIEAILLKHEARRWASSCHLRHACVIRRRSDGSAAWIAPPPRDDMDDAWTAVRVDGQQLIANSWSCYEVCLDLNNGRETSRTFTK
jgi:transcriptional regulator with XRE-family HTH domain